MDKLVKALNIAAFCCSVAAAVSVLLLASGMSGKWMSVSELNRVISNFVAGYSCCYGLTLWIKKANVTLSVGLMVIGTLILAVNIVTAG